MQEAIKDAGIALKKLIISMLTGQARITMTNTKRWRLKPSSASMRINLR